MRNVHSTVDLLRGWRMISSAKMMTPRGGQVKKEEGFRGVGTYLLRGKGLP